MARKVRWTRPMTIPGRSSIYFTGTPITPVVKGFLFLCLCFPFARSLHKSSTGAGIRYNWYQSLCPCFSTTLGSPLSFVFPLSFLTLYEHTADTLSRPMEATSTGGRDHPVYHCSLSFCLHGLFTVSFSFPFSFHKNCPTHSIHTNQAPPPIKSPSPTNATHLPPS